MFVTNHVLIGALIAQELPMQLILACVLAFISHFLIDIVPHGDTDLYRGYLNGNRRKMAIFTTVVDAAIAAGLLVFFILRAPSGYGLSTLFILLFSAAPDILVGFQELLPTRFLNCFHRVHFFFHGLITRQVGDVSHVAGLGIEAVLVVLITWRLVIA